MKRVADTEEVWSLRASDGWVLTSDGDRELIPVWPHPRYATACATAEWANAETAAIAVQDWLDVWIPDMIEDGRGVSVFPVPSGRGVVVEPSRLRDDLLRELDRYE